MRKQIISYEDVGISQETKEKCIQYLKDNPITIYWDYRDKLSLEQVDKLMESEDALAELETDIWENNIDYIGEREFLLLENLRNEFSELKDVELEDLREEFREYITTDLNIDQLIKNTPAVRIRIVLHSNYEGVGWQDRGKGDFKGNEYIREIKRVLRSKYNKKSFQQELDNICSHVNQLIFYGNVEIQDLIGIKERFKNNITIPKEAWCGFFDSWSGSGSVLEIDLLKDVTIKKQYGATEYDTVRIVLDENHKYSVEAVYGLCGVPTINLKVK